MLCYCALNFYFCGKQKTPFVTYTILEMVLICVKIILKQIYFLYKSMYACIFCSCILFTLKKEMRRYITTFLIRETMLHCYFSLMCLNSVVGGICSLLMMDCA